VAHLQQSAWASRRPGRIIDGMGPSLTFHNAGTTAAVLYRISFAIYVLISVIAPEIM
jgi:hypothetical protein